MIAIRPIVTALLAARQVAGSVNSYYFSFPSKTTEVPLVHAGDVLNVTWYSGYTQAILVHWCGTSDKMETITGLSNGGFKTFTVNTSWTSPCHWQLVPQNDNSGYVDSGWVDVTNAKASAAATWQPVAAGVACGQSTVTATVSAAAATSGAASAAATTGGSTATCVAAGGSNGDDGAAKRGLGQGASMGIGVAIGAVAASAVSALAWVTLMRKRKGAGAEATGMYEKNGSDADAYLAHQQQQYPPRHVQELNPEASRVEADGTSKRFTPAELPPHDGGWYR